MKQLGKKNLTYSMLLASVMVLLLVGYFIWMLPSLYVSYVEEQNVKALKIQHEAFMKNGSYDGVPVKNPTACVSIRIPLEEHYIELASKMISMKITASDAQTIRLMDELQQLIRGIDLKKIKDETVNPPKRIQTPASERASEKKGTDTESDIAAGNNAEESIEIRRETQKESIQNADWKEQYEKFIQYWNELQSQQDTRIKLPVRIEILRSEHAEEQYYGESCQVHELTQHRIIMESSVRDAGNQYTNYLAAEKTAGSVVFSVLPAITPQMGEIRPIVLQSLPMICAVIFMLVLIFSQIYSDGIVHPVYRKLQDINQHLKEENERQEMFLKASSHQLKTPVTAALLLLDGMINQIGKYKDTAAYLPKVKEQLLSMRRMTDEILSLNQKRESIKNEEIRLYDLLQSQLAAYRVTASDRQLEIILEGDRDISIRTDADILGKIFDSLLSNAAAYTPAGNKIHIQIRQHSCIIRNEGTQIPDDILPHIFEPFVRGSHEVPSHGLGLYIASYYANLLNAELTVCNKAEGVEAIFSWR